MNESINCVIMPITNGKILVPNATVAAMVSFTEVGPADGYPDFILGLTTWQGWHMPLLSMSKMLGLCDEESFQQARIAVIKTIGNGQQLPYYGLLLQGFPRLTEIHEENIILAETSQQSFAAIDQNADTLLTQVEQLGEPVWIPNLVRLSELVKVKMDD